MAIAEAKLMEIFQELEKNFYKPGNMMHFTRSRFHEFVSNRIFYVKILCGVIQSLLEQWEVFTKKKLVTRWNLVQWLKVLSWITKKKTMFLNWRVPKIHNGCQRPWTEKSMSLNINVMFHFVAFVILIILYKRTMV